MTGTRYDDQPTPATDARERLLVEFDDAMVVSANEQECRGSDLLQRRAREVRPPATRNHSTYAIDEPRRRYESCRRASACTEKADRKHGSRRVSIKPVHRADEPVSQKLNIEHIRPIGLFFNRQEIEQKRCKSLLLEGARDRRVARTEAAGTAPMRKNDQATWLFWNEKRCSKAERWQANLVFQVIFRCVSHVTSSLLAAGMRKFLFGTGEAPFRP